MKLIQKILFAMSLLFIGMQPVMALNQGACIKDEEKFCKDAPMQNDGKKKCMKEHLNQLSDACKANILDMTVLATGQVMPRTLLRPIYLGSVIQDVERNSFLRKCASYIVI